jgi:hypothetical protein
MMQFQAFLFAAYGLIASRPRDNTLDVGALLQLLIPCIGWFGAFAANRGVTCAHEAVNALKSAYLASLDKYKLSHLRPFGAHSQHNDGLFISATFPRTMMLIWVFILLFVVAKQVWTL